MEGAMKWENRSSGGRQNIRVEVGAFVAPEDATEDNPTPAWRWTVNTNIGLEFDDDKIFEGKAVTCAEAKQQAEKVFLSALREQLEKAEASSCL